MNRRFRVVFSVLVAGLVTVLAVAPVMAAPPLDVHIEVQSTFAGGDPFTATGSAVDAGLLCEVGTVHNLSAKRSGPPEGTFATLRMVKQFECQDGSGTFDVRLLVHLDLTPEGIHTGTWEVVGGTGDYAGLHGNGELIGIVVEPGWSTFDIYDGRML